jgi:hypothetical protein
MIQLSDYKFKYIDNKYIFLNLTQFDIPILSNILSPVNIIYIKDDIIYNEFIKNNDITFFYV